MSRCAQCIYYSPLKESLGECRESPPRVFPIPVRTMEGDRIGFQPVFPQVSADTWCGAYDDGDSVDSVIGNVAILPPTS